MVGTNNGEIHFAIPEVNAAQYLWSESWRLAWPVFVGQAVSQSMILISRVMIGVIGDSTLAALGMGQMIFFAIVMGLASVSVGMVALMAREAGAGNPREASRIFGQGVFFGTLLSVGLAAAGILFARPIFAALHTPPEVAGEAALFMRIVFIGLPFASASFFLGAGLRGAGDTRTPMIITIAATVLNVVVQYGLVFGKWHMPRMGISGAGVAMSVSFAAALLLFMLLFWFKWSAIAVDFSGFRIDWSIIRRLLKIGGPTAVEWELIQLGLIAFITIINHYGPEPAAAYIIGLTILNFSQLPAMGYNVSATTLVGMCLGARRPDMAETAVKINLRASLTIMTIIGVGLFFFAGPVIRLLFPASSEHTVNLARMYLQAVAIAQPLMAIGFVQAGSLRGAGYSLSPMIVQSTGMYVFRIGLALVLWKAFNAPVHWLWLTQIPDFIFRVLFLSLSVRRGKWKYIKV